MTDTHDPPPDDVPADPAPTTPAQRQLIETLFRTSYQNLVTYALCLRAPTRDDAEDVVQQAFQNVLAGHPCLTDPADGAVLKYLYATIDGLLKNVWRDTAVDHRHRTYNTRAVQAVVGPSPLPATDSAVLTADLNAVVQRIIRALPTRQRQVYLLRRQGYTYLQIAALLQISVSTVNGHMVRALDRLRDALDDEDADTDNAKDAKEDI